MFVGMAAVAAIIVLACFAIIGILVSLARRTRRQGRQERPSPADTAIILGAYTDGWRPSGTLVARLRAGLHLFRHGYVATIIVSGGRGDDETVRESSSMKRFLVINGVPAQLVFEERFSTDTWENLRYSKQVMERVGLKTAVIVTSDYHLPRALAIAHQLDMNVSGYPALSTKRDGRYAIREVLAILLYRLQGRLSLQSFTRWLP